MSWLHLPGSVAKNMAENCPNALERNIQWFNKYGKSRNTQPPTSIHPDMDFSSHTCNVKVI